jgi:anti-sigma factor RsiW
MARCDDIKLLLGPFEDGELEPHEMQEVARHVVGCTDCELELADYRTLAVGLRNVAPMPDLAGFNAAVMARIADLPVPFRVRIRRYMTSFSDGIGATLATGFAAAAVAVVTAVILTPYFKRASFDMTSRAPAQVASSVAPGSATTENLARADRQSAIPADVANGLSPGGGEVAPVAETPNTPANSEAIISRLEAESPSVAVWTEPKSDTTVIWVPDQQR